MQENNHYLVQYTDDATAQMQALDADVRIIVRSRILVISGMAPGSHGEADRDIEDRRRVHISPATVTFWVSDEVKVLTVVRVCQDTRDDGTPIGVKRPPVFDPHPSGSFVIERLPA